MSAIDFTRAGRIQSRATELLAAHPGRREGVADSELWVECVRRATREEDEQMEREREEIEAADRLADEVVG